VADRASALLKFRARHRRIFEEEAATLLGIRAPSRQLWHSAARWESLQRAGAEEPFRLTRIGALQMERIDDAEIKPHRFSDE
jgi:hypothetical protein